MLRAEGFALHERMTLTTAGGDSNRCSYIAVANQHPYTFLGPLPVRAAPRADFEHGLDVVFTRELRSRDLWRLPVYGLIWPRHAGHGSRRVGYLHDLERFTVDCDEPTAIQLDGEYVGHVDRVEFSLPAATRSRCSCRPGERHRPGVYHSPPMDLVIAISQGLGLAAAAGPARSRPAGDRRHRRHPGLAGRAARLRGRCRHGCGGLGRWSPSSSIADSVWPGAQAGLRLGRRIVAGGLAFELAAGDKVPYAGLVVGAVVAAGVGLAMRRLRSGAVKAGRRRARDGGRRGRRRTGRGRASPSCRSPASC